MNEVSDRVCIIGAGSSGIATCKVLKDHAIPYDCYEASDRIGGNWAYNNPNNMSSAYASLFINTSKERMEYSDFPMPADYPTFPHHTQMAAYFNSYADHFNIRPSIRFNTTVTRAEPLTGGGWEVTLDDGSTHRYRALCVANGHHWDPRWPEPPFPGHFDGEIIHSHYYRVPDPYVGKHVLILGFGNSAMDIATETSRVSAMTYLAVRRGFHVIPKHILGRPLDQPALPRWIPWSIQMKLIGLALRIQVGRMSNYGLPEPDHPVLHEHPTVSSDILTRISHGRVKPKPNIQRLDGDGVIFTDGSRERVDCIIYCTGYKITFPFFRPEVVEAKNNELPLFRRVFHPQYRDLFFIGLLQPLGAIMPLAELQSIWVSKYLLGEYALPPQDEMLRDIQREREALRKRFGNAPRHTMEVDYDPYVREVWREMKRGAKRPGAVALIKRAAAPVQAGASKA
ncbi:MAG TPA: NAD(P)-binding domain-containing protein [Ktedonobacteraceae bacterium]|nr:NAD(P)-binding domain-containing protein [Ktedonobacteraceae bacterium]